MIDESAVYIVDETTENIKNLLEEGTGGSGIPPANLSVMSAAAGDQKVKLKFAVAKETIIENQVVQTTAGIIVRRKAGSAPESITDGDLVVDCGPSEYAETAFEDTGLDNDTEYFYRFFPYSDHNVYNKNEANIISATPKEYILYGFYIDPNDSNPATRVHYTDMAEGMTPAKMNFTTGEFDAGSWDETVFFRVNNKPYMVKSNGQIDYELDPNDYTKKADGSGSSAISDTGYDGNAMARFDTVWLYQYKDSQGRFNCKICNIQLDSNYHAAKNNGSLWSTRSWAQRNLVNMLLILMGRSTDTQATFGQGHDSGGSQASHLTKTGTLYNKGAFFGTNTNAVMKVFHIENWWGNAWERIEGLVTDANKQILVKMKKPYNQTGAGYTATGITPGGTSGGYISAADMKEYGGYLPKTASGSSSTYDCDGLWFAASCYAIVGGSCHNGALDGAFAVDLDNAVSISYWAFGAALSCEQPVSA